MSAHIEIQIIAILAIVACVIPGVFLILRKMAMICDSITHTILLGIVISFFIVQDLSSPILILGAALMGIFTVYLTELVNKTKLVSEDSAIGLVFPALFSIAIIMISKFASSVHLCVDSVFLGEIEFAPFDRLMVAGTDIGPKAVYLIGIITLLNILYILIFYKELKLITFDEAFAFTIGFSPAIIHYTLMTIVSITTVGVFQAVGSILVISFMIGPPATAYLITEDLRKMLIYSIIIGIINSIIGHTLAIELDVSIAGMISTITGLTFFLVFILSPKNGIIMNILRRRKQKIEFIENSILYHIFNHKDCSDYEYECSIETINEHFKMKDETMSKIIQNLNEKGYIVIKNKIMDLTENGLERVKKIYE